MSGDPNHRPDHDRARLGINLCLDLLGPTHPRFRSDRLDPVGEARNEAQVLADMLLANPSGRDHTAGGEGNRWPEDGLGEPDSCRMVKHGSMAIVRRMGF